jgi:hypothetical protein
MLISEATVHTSGINWESIGVIIAFVSLGFGILAWWIARRDARQEIRNNEIKTEISDSVNHLSDVLTARLETKEAVNQISVRLGRVEGAIQRIEKG